MSEVLFEITILGCGSSSGVPSIHSGFGSIDPKNPKNTRTRSSIFINFPKENNNLLIDTSPDLRMQLLTNKIFDIKNVLITHAHADHILGADELRQIFYLTHNKINLYTNEETFVEFQKIFPHLIEQKVADREMYKPCIIPNIIKGNLIELDDLKNAENILRKIKISTFELDHVFTKTIGIRINNFAYTTDVKNFSEENLLQLEGVTLWIIDCVRYQTSKTHLSIQNVIDLKEKIRPKKMILTHMGNDLDYEKLKNELSELSIEPAYDTMKICYDSSYE